MIVNRPKMWSEIEEVKGGFMRSPLFFGLIVYLLVFFVFAMNSPVLAADSVTVTSYPKDARIYLDGKFVGFTPMILEYVKPGTHVIEFRKDGYMEHAREFDVQKGKNASIAVEMKEFVATPFVVREAPQVQTVFVEVPQKRERSREERRKVRLRNTLFGAAAANEIFTGGKKKKDIRKGIFGGAILNELINQK